MTQEILFIYPVQLAFFDIGVAGQQFLNVPPALENTMFPAAYDLGVRVHTNSLGSRGNGYSSNSRSVDVFSFEQQDFLVLFAAGNDGAGGAGTVGAPATAKNALSVGASYSPTESFSEEFGAQCALQPCEVSPLPLFCCCDCPFSLLFRIVCPVLSLPPSLARKCRHISYLIQMLSTATPSSLFPPQRLPPFSSYHRTALPPFLPLVPHLMDAPSQTWFVPPSIPS